MIAEFKNSVDTSEDKVEAISQKGKEKGRVGKWEKKFEESTEKSQHPTSKFLESKQSDQHKDFKRPTPRHIIVKTQSTSEPIVCLWPPIHFPPCICFALPYITGGWFLQAAFPCQLTSGWFSQWEALVGESGRRKKPGYFFLSPLSP